MGQRWSGAWRGHRGRCGRCQQSHRRLLESGGRYRAMVSGRTGCRGQVEPCWQRYRPGPDVRHINGRTGGLGRCGASAGDLAEAESEGRRVDPAGHRSRSRRPRHRPDLWPRPARCRRRHAAGGQSEQRNRIRHGVCQRQYRDAPVAGDGCTRPAGGRKRNDRGRRRQLSARLHRESPVAPGRPLAADARADLRRHGSALAATRENAARWHTPAGAGCRVVCPHPQ